MHLVHAEDFFRFRFSIKEIDKKCHFLCKLLKSAKEKEARRDINIDERLKII